jgi:7,8-dihydropterin-6-yl-methyl-4-(beta-D-ribofuranosyl)aminobenzene 5'-phosphate synthase
MFLFIRHLLNRRAASSAFEKLGRTRVDISEPLDRVTIEFLVDFYAEDEQTATEAGVSYLISTEHHKLLFDLGYNQAKAEVSPLRANLAARGHDKLSVDGVFISHNHLDHVGGFANQRNRNLDLDQAGVSGSPPVWTPVPFGTATTVHGPTELLPGLASTGAMPAPMYFLGMLHEHALLAALRGRGLVLITGCGHPGISAMVEHAKHCTGEDVYAVVGGLHLIASRGRNRSQKYLAANQPPWRLLGAAGVRREVEKLRRLGVVKVVPSAHDSCDESLAIMKEVFADDYIPLRAGGGVEFTASP